MIERRGPASESRAVGGSSLEPLSPSPHGARWHAGEPLARVPPSAIAQAMAGVWVGERGNSREVAIEAYGPSFGYSAKANGHLITQNPRAPMTALRTLLAYLAAALTTAALGSLIQTQINLAALQDLGAPITPTIRLQASAQDLLGFAPLWAAILALGFLIAFVTALLISHALKRHRTILLVAAGTVSVFATLWLMQMALPITVIAATRGSVGFALMGLTGAVGGWMFAWLSARTVAVRG